MPGPFYFAWSGGSIAEQVTVVTTGNTHGGTTGSGGGGGVATIRTVSFVGDITNGGQQILNVSSNDALTVGKLYLPSGDGITPGTIFIFDDTALTNPARSINLSVPATATRKYAAFTATEAVPLLDVYGVTNLDSDFVTFDTTTDLLDGIYAVSGEPVGYTWVPGTGETRTMPVPSAWFVYHGSNTVPIWVFASSETVTTGDTTYAVAPQGVFATKSGYYVLHISGFVDAETAAPGDELPGDTLPWYVVTGIPAEALAGLTPGVRYNIAGNGIPAGTTFIAPESGATSLELDQQASSAEVGALLTITGPRATSEPFDPAVHLRFDEDVLAIEIAQSEGEFATLTIDIKNSGIGMLAAGRNLWCWLSIAGAPDPVPLFHGRLVGVPKLAAGEVIQLQFLAQPDDFNVQKRDLANAMMVLPFWDPVWLAENAGNPDTVLEAYSALWHTDRITLDVTASDILEGEAGLWTVSEDQAFYDSFSMSFGDAPRRHVSVSGTVAWEQTGEGFVDVTGPLFSAFGAAGNYRNVFTSTSRTYQALLTGGGVVYTFNGTSVKSSWPQPGTNIGGGWEVAPGVAGDGKPYSFMLDATAPIGWLRPYSFNVTYLGPPPKDLSRDPNTPPEGETDFNVFINHGTWTWSFALNAYHIRMVLHYQASRKRTETVRAVMVADIMEQVSDNTSGTEEITYSSENVAAGIDPGGGIPLGTAASRSYFQTDRGAASFEYLLLAARAKLRAAARSVEITFAVDFPQAIAISLRHSVALFDRRIPGGSAVGKVKSYRITVGESGMWGEFTIGCTIGHGAPATAVTGINAYVDAGYVEPGYQVIAGGQYMFLTGELAYQSLDQFEVVDDGLDLTHVTAAAVVKSCTVVNGMTKQLAELNKYQNVSMPAAGLSDPFDATKKLATNVTLELLPVTGSEYHTDFLPAVSMLAIPMTIDLRAPPPDPSMWDARHPAGDSTWDDGGSTWDEPPPGGRHGKLDRYYEARAGLSDHGISSG